MAEFTPSSTLAALVMAIQQIDRELQVARADLDAAPRPSS
jgi:hypothetical protein